MEMKSKKEFYKWIMFLIIPIAGQNLINVSVTSTDVIMMGLVSKEALSAVSLASGVQFILTLFYSGLSSGAMVLMSQYWGKKDFESIKQVVTIVLRFAFVFGILFSLSVFLIPNQIMSIFTNEQEVIGLGAKYLRIVGISYILSSFSVTYLNVIRSVERVLVAAITYSISFVVNVMVNSVLIFGMFGITPLGVKGAAIGTVIARVVEVVIVFFYSKYKVKEIKIKLKDFFFVDKLLLKDFFKYSFMVTLNEFFWGLGITLISVIIGHMGVDVIGANSVALVTRQLAMVVTFGIATATAVVIGKSIGEQNYDLVWVYAKMLLRITIIFSVAGSLLIILIRPILLSNFAITALSKSYLSSMIYVLAYTNLAQAINATLIVGVFRGGGDTKFGLLVDAIGLWFFAIPVGAIMAFLLKCHPIVVYMFLVSDEIVKIPFTLKRFVKKSWIKNVTR